MIALWKSAQVNRMDTGLGNNDWHTRHWVRMRSHMAIYRDDWRLTGFFQGISAIALAGGCAIASGNPALAQVTPDATLGAERSKVISILGIYEIQGGATRGTNLFHSFSQFSIPANNAAVFLSAPNIQNIISRVTGNSVSNINGEITAFSKANVFLINPNGIIFGPKAQIAFAGSFVVSTATSLVFANGTSFSATNSQASPLLTVNLPVGLQYGAHPTDIQVQGSSFLVGQTLALVGGNIQLDNAKLSASGGRVELGGVATMGTVGLHLSNNSLSLEFPKSTVRADVSLNGTKVDTVASNGGSIAINAHNLNLVKSSLLAAAEQGSSLPQSQVGDIDINASGDVTLTNGSLIADTTAFDAGKGGNISIKAESVFLRDGSEITTIADAGKGGNLTVNATDLVVLSGVSTDGNTPSNLTTATVGTGNSGNLTINTGTLRVQGGAEVIASTAGSSGNAGTLTVRASQGVQLTGTTPNGQLSSGLFTNSELGATGKGGDIRIDTGTLLVQEGAVVTASTSGSGNAGNLRIDTGTLLVQGGAALSASTSGSGNAGNLSVRASQGVQLTGTTPDGQLSSGLFTSTASGTTGNGGNLKINTDTLRVQGGAEVTASTSGSGKAGNLRVHTSQGVQLIGTSADGQLSSGLFTSTASGTRGNGGNLRINTDTLRVQDGAAASASTSGSGKAGNLSVQASKGVQLIGTSLDGRLSSRLLTSTQDTGKAGDLTITTDQLLVSGGAQASAGTLGAGDGGSLIVNATDKVQLVGTSLDGQLSSGLLTSTQGTGKAGDLTITTDQLLVSGGAQASAGTLGAGDGGSLTVKATDQVQLSGTGSRLFVGATTGGTAGSLSVKTQKMSVVDGAQVSVSSPQGQAGNLNITTDSLTLNQGRVTAETAKSEAEGGANITLQGLKFLRMDNESLISATAFNQANGGNVKIDSTFIVATSPTGSNGSDIQANAYQGNGGRVDITTQGLFGTQFRPKQTPDNDITASSEFGINGEVTINQPNVDPRRGLTELPTTVVDATRQIDRRCTSTGADRSSSFVITGRGGLPPSPNDPLQGEAVIANWVTLDSKAENTNSEAPKANARSTAPKQLVEAQSWVYDADGRVILVAQAPTATPQSPWQTSPSCRDLQTKVK